MTAAAPFTDAELLAYLDEALPVERMAAIETELRQSAALKNRAAVLLQGRDQGEHSVGEIWRRGRLSCPTRHQLGSFLLGALDAALVDYIDFHLHTVGCRLCAANLDDLQRSAQPAAEVEQRRQKIFQSSAGYVRKIEEQPLPPLS